MSYSLPPLNPLLHARLEKHFGQVQIMRERERNGSQYRTSPGTRFKRLRLTKYGEAYLVQCPHCRWLRLEVNYQYGEYDPVAQMPNYHLIKCRKLNCFREPGLSTELLEMLEQIEIPAPAVA